MRVFEDPWGNMDLAGQARPVPAKQRFRSRQTVASTSPTHKRPPKAELKIDVREEYVTVPTRRVTTRETKGEQTDTMPSSGE